MQLAGFSLHVERISTDEGMTKPHAEVSEGGMQGSPGSLRVTCRHETKSRAPFFPRSLSFHASLSCAHSEPQSTAKLLFAEPVAVCSLCVLSVQLCFKNLRMFWSDLCKLLMSAKPVTCCRVCHLQRQSVCAESVLGLQNMCLICRASFCPEPVLRVSFFRTWVFLNSLSLFLHG